MTPPEAIDLAALRRLLLEDGPYEMRPHSVTLSSGTFLALLDRLAAATAVIEKARYCCAWDGDPSEEIGLQDLLSAVEAYDRAIAGQQRQEGTT